MNISKCNVCGHLEFKAVPETCPVCGSEKKEYSASDAIFKESKEKSPEAEVKHVPAVSVNRKCGIIPEEECFDVLARIGATLHPMQDKHYIQFVDCYQDDRYISRVAFTPNGVSPAACFHLKNGAGVVTVVEKCNIHGYWKTDVTL